MRYGELITRSLEIVWRHKYLWLLGALGGGEAAGGGGGSGNFGNFSSRSGPNGPNGQPLDPNQAGTQISQWLGDHVVLILTVGALLLLLGLAYFLLSCVTRGALIRAAAEHDAERPFGLRLAWRAGLRSFWSILGLRLLTLLFWLLVVLVIGVLVLLGVLSGVSHNGAALAAVIVLGVLLALALIPIAIGAGLIVLIAARSIVLEQRGAVAAIRRGWELLSKRLGRVLLIWLIQIGISLVLGIALILVFLILLVPLAAIVFAVYSSAGLGAAIGWGLVALAIFVLAAIAIGGGAGSIVTTYWTLAFRRLDLDPVSPPAPL